VSKTPRQNDSSDIGLTLILNFTIYCLDLYVSIYNIHGVVLATIRYNTIILTYAQKLPDMHNLLRGTKNMA